MPSTVVCERIPGFHRPGLIEASGLAARPARANVFRGFIAPASLKLLRHWRAWCGHPVFRGFIAPASLKQHSPAVGLADSERIPGFHRPGLIEASGTSGRKRTRFVFRGFIAPASLKQRAAEQKSEGGARIPGFHHPGLIKHEDKG